MCIPAASTVRARREIADMAGKYCHECQHYQRKRNGPHEWLIDCFLRQADFPDAGNCGQYAPRCSVMEDDD